MSKEVELRIIANDDSKALNWLKKNATFKQSIKQIDIYIDHISNPFFYLDEQKKLQSDYWLRLRMNMNKDPIFCLKKAFRDENKNYLYAEEHETIIQNKEEFLKIMSMIGFNPAITIEKSRTEWTFNDFIIAYDEINDLGTFFEFELVPNNDSYENNVYKITALIENILGKNFIFSKDGYPTLLYNKAY